MEGGGIRNDNRSLEFATNFQVTKYVLFIFHSF